MTAGPRTRTLFFFLLLAALALGACDGGSSEDDAATPTPDAGSGETYDCDPKHVTCERLPPECPPGFLPAVTGDCWDVCVPQLECDPIACDDTGPAPQCPDGWGCVGSECRPPR